MKYAWLGAAALTIAASAPVSASAVVTPVEYGLQQSYEVVSPYDLHHGISYNTYGNPEGSGMTNSYNLLAPGGIATDAFTKSSSNPPLLTYIMFSSNLDDFVAADVEGQDGHLVIGVNDVFATSLLTDGSDFSVLFDGYDESSLIAALTLIDTADLAQDDPGHDAQQQAKQDAYDLLFNFSATLTTDGALTNADGGSMTLVSFSTPAPAGTATSTLNRVALTSDTPEPATWLLMVGGFGAIGFAMRRRQAPAFG